MSLIAVFVGPPLITVVWSFLAVLSGRAAFRQSGHAKLIWLWVLVPGTLVTIMTFRQDDAWTSAPNVFASVATPIVFTLILGVLPAWRMVRTYSRDAKAPFGSVYWQVARPLGLAALTLFLALYFGLRR